MRRVLIILVLAMAPAPGATDVALIVRGVEARYQSARTMKAAFLHRYTESRNALRVESGTVYFSRGGKMRWEYESPEEKLFVADGKMVWFYVPADRTVTRTKMKESAGWQTPLALLVGKAKFSRVCGRVEVADARVSAAENVVLRCLPKSADSGFSELLVEVDGRYRLVRVLIHEPGGVETEFRFGKWEENIPLTDTLFRFVAPPGVAIVEESSIAGPLR
ncbi:MAG: outer membrane lipoprotein carrier protein LolA [Acidobacteria bacterium]|nr:outer membrane lipoprotein carrier protein LolA [Acidobacteriota bacterium]MBI3662745.1 outer membrane lipoprotein carrier protein LolA [Acidobacteriota bacterium]